MLLAAVDLWILAFSSVTVLVTIWMGFRSAKTSKSASDFFVQFHGCAHACLLDFVGEERQPPINRFATINSGFF